jgi:hypothetical protein
VTHTYAPTGTATVVYNVTLKVTDNTSAAAVVNGNVTCTYSRSRRGFTCR